MLLVHLAGVAGHVGLLEMPPRGLQLMVDALLKVGLDHDAWVSPSTKLGATAETEFSSTCMAATLSYCPTHALQLRN